MGGPGKAVLLNREILIKKEIEDLLELSRAGKLGLCDDGGDADLMCSGPGVDLGDQFGGKLEKSESLPMCEDLRSKGTLKAFSEIGLREDLG